MKSTTFHTPFVIALALGGALDVEAQLPEDGEVRQLVTFHFLPGRAGDALDLYRERALPLYERDAAMLSFRAFREVESPIPLDLIVVSAFRGMRGMDESNAALRALAAAAGSSIGEIYGGIGALSSRHDDQFVEMLPALGNGDPSAQRLVALVWYETEPGRGEVLEALLEDEIVPWEREEGISSSTGRFLISDGWGHLRFLGFDSLAQYQGYWARVSTLEAHRRLARITERRREVIVTPASELSVR